VGREKFWEWVLEIELKWVVRHNGEKGFKREVT